MSLGIVCHAGVLGSALRAGRVLRLGDEPLVDDRDRSTVDERLALVARLTHEVWAFSGQPVPDYGRDQMPGKVIRPRCRSRAWSEPASKDPS